MLHVLSMSQSSEWLNDKFATTIIKWRRLRLKIITTFCIIVDISKMTTKENPRAYCINGIAYCQRARETTAFQESIISNGGHGIRNGQRTRETATSPESAISN